MHLMRHSDRRLSDHLYTDTALLPGNETVQKLSVPVKAVPQIPSQDLVPTGQSESHAVTTETAVNGSAKLINAWFQHGQTLPVTACQNGEMVRAAGFEPATSCV